MYTDNLLRTKRSYPCNEPISCIADKGITVLAQSSSIVRYLGDCSSLGGHDSETRALVDSASHELEEHVTPVHRQAVLLALD